MATVQNDLDEAVEIEKVDETAQLMERPFDPTLINIETKTPSLDTLISRIQHDEVEMNSDKYFQRKDDLWNPTQQSRLIESILIRFPLPAFFFDATTEKKWLIVDGLQRMSSIRNFCVKKTLSLTNMEFLTQLNGKRWDDLSTDLQRVIKESQVVIHKILPGTPTDVKFNIFKRINTGGLSLESQEIRHALFQVRPARFVAELAHEPAFLAATQSKIKPDRMLDREFANRFLGFYLLGSDTQGFDLNSFMSKALASIHEKSDDDLAKIRSDFSNAMALAKDVFGEEAFRKIFRDEQRLPPINKALFDAIATQFALATSVERTKVFQHREEFKRQLRAQLALDSVFFASVTSFTDDRSRVKYRHDKIRELIQRASQ
jgi:hypothetical protein